jgi:chemotaxis protein MotC
LVSALGFAAAHADPDAAPAAPAVPAAAAPVVEDMRPPFALIRKLQSAQEQLAHGNRAGQAVQAQLMAAIPSRFLAADPAVWRDPRNARAAILYLFSGGRPAVIRTILSRSTMPREIDPLLKGALAYSEGQDKIALELLQPIDPRSLPSYIGGQLALVEATLLSPKDKAKAAKLLDLSRLLVPGTLVEEAALRRQIFLDTDPSALTNFVFLSREYIHRFHNSIYAENFKQHFKATAINFASLGDIAELGMLDAVITELPPDEQSALYLAVAKAAIVKGKTTAARFAAERAAAIARSSSRDTARAQLYIDASMIVSEDVAKGVDALEAADRSRLSPEDADLRDAALAVARAVTSPVPDADGVASAASDDAASRALVDQANQAIASGDKLLQDGAP